MGSASTSNTGWNVKSVVKQSCWRNLGPKVSVLWSVQDCNMSSLYFGILWVCSGDRMGHVIRPHACLVMSFLLEFWQTQGDETSNCPRQWPDLLADSVTVTSFWLPGAAGSCSITLPASPNTLPQLHNHDSVSPRPLQLRGPAGHESESLQHFLPDSRPVDFTL